MTNTQQVSNTSALSGTLPVAFGYTLTLGLALASWAGIIWVVRMIF